MRISASFHHVSRRDNPSNDMTRETIRKISFKPTNRRSSHPPPARHMPARRQTRDRADGELRCICPGGRSFRHAQDRHAAAQRNLFGRLLGCLHHCLATGQHYDEATAFPAATAKLRPAA
ncbi:MAG: hypothetical protein ACRDOL_42995 [Streptosporangiaceae bacterium]